MKGNVMRKIKSLLFFYLIILAGISILADSLPIGAKVQWDLKKAWCRKNDFRENICLNGLWRFRSAKLNFILQQSLMDRFENAKLAKWEILPGDYKAVRVKNGGFDGKAAMKIDFDLPERKNFYHLRKRFWLPKKHPDYIELSMQLKTALKSGYILIEAQTRIKGKLMSWQITPKLQGGNDWKKYSKQFQLPEEAKYLGIYVRNYGNGKKVQGTVWLDDIKIRLGRKGISGKAPVSKNEIDKFGYIKVPGDWCGFGMKSFLNSKDPAVKNGRYSIKNAWYQREFVVPADWNNRKIFLKIGKISTEAEVFINADFAGKASYMGEKIDITRFVRPREKVLLSILIKVKSPAQALGVSSSSPLPVRRGIQGDVFLSCVPNSKIRLENYLVETCIQPVKIKLHYLLNRSVPASEQIRLVCNISQKGKTLKKISAVIKTGTKKGIISADCPELRLWDVGKPVMYDMEISLVKNNIAFDRTLTRKVGFREFKIKNKYFYLNGQKNQPVSRGFQTGILLLGDACDNMKKWLKKTVAAGHNFVFLETMDKPGSEGGWIDCFLDIADEMGVLTAVTPPEVNIIWKHFDLPRIRRSWEKACAKRITENWNHPSLVLWRMNMNFLGYDQYQHPMLLDGSQEPPVNSSWGSRKAVAMKASAWIEKLDPTRRTYQHAGGCAGNIYCINSYLCRPKMQDLREYLKYWAKNGKKPLMMGEFDLPYPGTMLMTDPANWWKNEPVMAEYGAMMLGKKAFQMLEDDYIELCDKLWDDKNKKWRSSYIYFCSAYPKILDECSAAYYAVTVPYWRGWGISGGINSWENASWRRDKRNPKATSSHMRLRIPKYPLTTDWDNLQQPGFRADEFLYPVCAGGALYWNFLPGKPEERKYLKPLKRGKVVKRIYAKELAFIAGKKENWTNQDHAFYSGDEFKKTVVIINDLKEKGDYVINWQVRVADKLYKRGIENICVEPACNQKVPVELKLPSATSEKNCELLVQVKNANSGKTLKINSFEFKIYPEFNHKALSGISFNDWMIFDPNGITFAALKKLGAENLKSVNGKLPENCKVLIVGSLALNKCSSTFLKLITKKMTQGMQVILFEQDASSLKKRFNLRTFSLGTRRVFLRDSKNPLFTGIDNDELRDWNGESSLTVVSPRPKSALESQRNKYVWTCSRQGTVASTVVEKPHRGNVRPLIDCEFGLNYLALWEVLEKKGRMIFCQLDVSERAGKSPVCDKLISSIIKSANSWKPAGQKQLIAFGNKACLKYFSLIDNKIKINPLELNMDVVNDKIIMLCRGSGDWIRSHASKLEQFIAKGGVVVATGLKQESCRELERISNGKMLFEKSICWNNPYSKSLPECFRGVGPNEIYWREKKQVMICKCKGLNNWNAPSGVLGMCCLGKGRIIWISALPGDFSPVKRPDLQMTQVNTFRLYAILFNNLGIDSGFGWSQLVGASKNKVKFCHKWVAAKCSGTEKNKWEKIKVPGFWRSVHPEWSDYIGEICYKNEFKVPTELKGQDLILFIGAVDDLDRCYVNGKLIGNTTKKTPNWWQTPRVYKIPAKYLNYDSKNNKLIIKVNNTFMDGGIEGPVRIGSGQAEEDDFPFNQYLNRLNNRDNPYAYMRW